MASVLASPASMHKRHFFPACKIHPRCVVTHPLECAAACKQTRAGAPPRTLLPPRPQALVDASVLLARTLHSLAGSPETPALEVNRTATRFLVAELAVCLILEDPGMRCPLASLLMSPGAAAPWARYGAAHTMAPWALAIVVSRAVAWGYGCS